MPAARDIDDILSAARARADQDQPGTGPRHTDDSEGQDLVNDSVAAFWEMLITAQAWELLATRAEVTPASATGPTLPTDFFKLLRLDVQDGTRWRQIHRLPDEDESLFDIGTGGPIYYRLEGLYDGGDVRLYPSPSSILTYRVIYVPEAPVLVSGGSPSTITLPNSWWRWIERDVAVELLLKEESDIRGVVAKRDEIGAAILSSAKTTDRSEPRRVRDTRGKLRGRYDIRTRRDLATWGSG